MRFAHVPAVWPRSLGLTFLPPNQPPRIDPNTTGNFCVWNVYPLMFELTSSQIAASNSTWCCWRRRSLGCLWQGQSQPSKKKQPIQSSYIYIANRFDLCILLSEQRPVRQVVKHFRQLRKRNYTENGSFSIILIQAISYSILPYSNLTELHMYWVQGCAGLRLAHNFASAQKSLSEAKLQTIISGLLSNHIFIYSHDWAFWPQNLGDWPETSSMDMMPFCAKGSTVIISPRKKSLQQVKNEVRLSSCWH